MANEEHLRIIRQGVRTWNRWREGSSKRADLSYADLSKADLRRVNCAGANLKEINVSGANLSEADLRTTYLIKANLSYADLSYADLSHAGLDYADLSYADLSYADLSYVELVNTSFIGAKLIETDLSYADLSNADLIGANFSKSDLSGRNFTEKNLSGADFQNANLQRSCLINANLDGANLTNAHLWETQRAGWSIKGVICQSVYWDKEAEKKSIYTEGEFEKLFTDLIKIQLSYKGGISLLEIATLPSLIQHLANTFPDCSLRFVNIHEDSGGKVVELAVEDIEDLSKEQIKQLQTALEKEAQQQVEYQRKALSEREKRLELEGEVKQLSLVVDKLIQRPNFIIQSMRDLGINDEKNDTYNISGGQQGAVGRNAHAHDMTFNKTINSAGESLDFVALAKELATLQIEIAKLQDSSPQAMNAAGEIAKAEIAAGEKDEVKVYEHLKAAGKWTLDTATKIGTSVAAEVIKKSMSL
jgi:uncharacterized protein YjbI with pentapeptide repeats